MSNIEKDYIKAEEVIKTASATFYKAFSMLPDVDMRKAIYGIYAFCRHADDVVDEKSSLKHLEKLTIKLNNYVLGKVKKDYIFRLLDDVSSKYYPDSYDYQPYYDMIMGQEMDLTKKRYANEEELLTYCRLVASSVGNMLTPILAPEADRQILGKIANDLGIAMQITNILRDVGEDYQRGRIYLPKTLMDKYGVSEQTIKQGKVTKEFINLFNDLADTANNYYDLALSNIKVFPFDSRFPLVIASLYYRQIINECKDNDYDVFSRKNYVNENEKNKLVSEAFKYVA